MTIVSPRGRLRPRTTNGSRRLFYRFRALCEYEVADARYVLGQVGGDPSAPPSTRPVVQFAARPTTSLMHVAPPHNPPMPRTGDDGILKFARRLCAGR